VLAVGEALPDATVWLENRERLSLHDLMGDSPMLLLFYLFDWSST
jgi:peroxiredoxin